MSDEPKKIEVGCPEIDLENDHEDQVSDNFAVNYLQHLGIISPSKVPTRAFREDIDDEISYVIRELQKELYDAQVQNCEALAKLAKKCGDQQTDDIMCQEKVDLLETEL